MQAHQEDSMGCNDHRALSMKGKRTKRPRSSSSRFGVPMTSSSSSSGGRVAEEYNSICSPTSGEIYESTEEEEEMAICLIMLAQSDGPKMSVEAKFKIATTMTNKAEFYVYECKVCNRSFPSFQELGGHKAGHKKPKSAIAKHEKPLVVTVKDTVVALRSVINKKGSNKIHECSICGSEFTSGQALGGHMRRHRAAAAVAASNTISISTASNSSKLLLDLNLPAPEDDQRDSQCQFETPQQAIVFSTPTLVDCHY